MSIGGSFSVFSFGILVFGCTQEPRPQTTLAPEEQQQHSITKVATKPVNYAAPLTEQDWTLPAYALTNWPIPQTPFSFPPTAEDDWSPVDRSMLLHLYREAYHPNYSGQVIIHLEPGHYVVNGKKSSGDARKLAFHLSPFARESRVPLIIYTPNDPEPGVRTKRATLRQIGATLYDVLDVERPTNVTAPRLEIPNKHYKGVVVLVFDALPHVFWEQYLGRLPHFAKIREQGREYTNTWLGQMPSNTTPSHAVIGTGVPPSQTGIPLNRTRTDDNRFDEVFQGDKPDRLIVPTVADLYDKQTNNQAKVLGFCSQSRATIAMVGHGKSFEDGDSDYSIWLRDHKHELQTNPDYYAELPAYLQGISAEAYREKLGTPTFLEHEIKTDYDLFTSPHNAIIGEHVVRTVMSEEGFGDDNITDLLFFNQKLLDNLGHRYGIETEEYRVGMHALDDFIGRFLNDLDRQFGDDYLLFFTSDHGFGPITSLEDERRHARQDLLKGIDKWFGLSVTTGFLDNNIYLDTATLQTLGYQTKDVCDYLLQHESSWISDCLTEEEITKEISP